MKKIKIMRWEEYKDFFQITIFKYLVMWFSIVPILAGLISAIPDHLELMIGENKAVIYLTSINPSLPFNWQLLWLSSLFFVIAFIWYLVRCPKFIRKYNNFSDYEAYGHDPRWIAWLVSDFVKVASKAQMEKFVDRLAKKRFLIEVTDETQVKKFEEPEVGERQTVCYFKHAEKTYGFGMPVYTTEVNPHIVPEAEKGVFYELFGRYSGSSAAERIIIFMLLSISLGLFAYVLVQHIWAGANYFCLWAKG